MRIWFLLMVGGVGVAILLWLGAWQVQRLAWKEDLLAGIAAQIDASPKPLHEALSPSFERYAPVSVAGRFGDGHIRMLASRKTIGPVYRIIRPFDAEGTGLILVDTGWVPEGTDILGAPKVPLTLIGNLDNPQEADGFTPAPDLRANIWFARDVPAMAQALGTQPILVVLRDRPATALDVTPWPVDTAGIPNDHLQYAITWFSLAMIWGAMTAFFLLRTRRSPR